MKELLKRQREIDETYFKGIRENTSLSYWGLAIGGEVGELQNYIKKYIRNHPKDESKEKLRLRIAEESADILIYLLILSDIFDFDLRETTYQKQEINIYRMKNKEHKCLGE